MGYGVGAQGTGPKACFGRHQYGDALAFFGRWHCLRP